MSARDARADRTRASPGRRWTALVYAGAAVLLLPWIVVLAVVQPPRGTTGQLNALRAVLVTVIAVLSVVVVLRPRTVPVTAPAVAGFAFAAAWFAGVTAQRVTPALAIGFGLLLVVGVAACMTSVTAASGHRSGHTAARITLAVLAFGGLWDVARLLHGGDAPVAVHHLKAAWVGLDIAEAATLAGVAFAAWTAAGWIRAVGSVAASLLLLDATVNIITSTGVGRVQALLMALAELPLALGALVLAVQGPSRRSGVAQVGR